MAVITITITESVLEKYAGIPASVTVATNIPATIFYTLDGTDPTIASSVATGPIVMPNDVGQVTLKVWATDGSSQSTIVTEEYGTTTVPQRQPHDKITGLDTTIRRATYPFGSSAPTPGVNGIYGNTGGTTVDAPLIQGYPAGWDGTATGTPATETDLAPDAASGLAPYDWLFSETDKIGERGRGIGTVPAHTVIIPDDSNDVPEASDANSPFFDPRAMVIYQDSREPPYDEDIPQLNRPSFSLERADRARDGRMLGVEGGVAPTGSVLKSQFNPRDNTITFYYYDNRTTRWIISKEEFQPRSPNLFNYASIVFPSRGAKHAGFVFKWSPGRYRRLF
jgi:hypothetical protein